MEEKLKKAVENRRATPRDMNALMKEADAFGLETYAGRARFAGHVLAKWTNKEIVDFQRYGVHSFILPRTEAVALQNLCFGLLCQVLEMVGAAQALHVEGARPFKWVKTKRLLDDKGRLRPLPKDKWAAIRTNDVEYWGPEDCFANMTYEELAQLVGNMTAQQSARRAQAATAAKK